MYYSSGNYEAFARPKRPEGVERKSAYIIGSGLAALTAACYLVRDAQMPGERIHVFERDEVAGGACDGRMIPGLGYVMRGGREMDNHFEVMWDLLRSIPSLDDPDVSVLDEYYWLNKEDPNFSLRRATRLRGQDAGTQGAFALLRQGRPGDRRSSSSRPTSGSTTRRSPTCSTTRCWGRTSGCTGAPCSPSRTGTAPWR